ncbi:4719_t:CDS:2, partial [Scutellospora calospora]
IDNSVIVTVIQELSTAQKKYSSSFSEKSSNKKAKKVSEKVSKELLTDILIVDRSLEEKSYTTDTR